MKIKVQQIGEESSVFHFTADAKWLAGIFPELAEAEFSLKRLSATGSAVRIGETVTLDISMDADIILECGRCLKEVEKPIRAEFRYVLVPYEPGEDEDPDSEDELYFGRYRDEEIEIDPIILEQLILRIPVRAVCDEACRGLCPQCGANLNEEQCRCERPAGHPGFGPLKNFKVKRK
ncbi:MAG TPA: DUF177 domain-containing protein [Syntrophales bacterium]|nr:DUF177 domain-containing protein [Syntrophales bacterium]